MKYTSAQANKLLKKLMNEQAQLERSLARIAHEIIEKNNGADRICLLGIKRRGIPMAQILHDNIQKFENIDVPVGHIDISLYRDDLSMLDYQPLVRPTEMPVDISGKTQRTHPTAKTSRCFFVDMSATNSLITALGQ